jgi:hypothetical protein
VGLTTPHRKNLLSLRNVSKRLAPGLILWHDLSIPCLYQEEMDESIEMVAGEPSRSTVQYVVCDCYCRCAVIISAPGAFTLVVFGLSL